MKIRHLFFLFCSISLLVGCGNRPYMGDDVLGAKDFVMDSYQIQMGKTSILNFEGEVFQPISSQLLEEYPDAIENGDVLVIQLFHPTRHDEINRLMSLTMQGFLVQQEQLVLPLIGSVQVKGLTLLQAQNAIQQKYQDEMQGIEVFLSYKERLDQKVEIAGLSSVHSMPVNGHLRLFEVIAAAKVPVQANLFKSYLVRDNKLLSIDFEKLIREGNMQQNVVMRGGDKIYIAGPECSNVYVMGEVKREGAFPMINNAMPLREALALAGGISFTGDKAYIQVIRGNLTRPKIYTLTWNHIIHLPTNSMLLIPGDIVYVAASPITQWNRFINQLFPSFTAYEFFNKGIQGVIVQ
ncbi:MAG: polysaccharide biosynthesis/export family protein [Simkaniaceae bacterium]|nr:polysaccharide biosynthesis/export family protein [Simkaniaceae bacterium]